MALTNLGKKMLEYYQYTFFLCHSFFFKFSLHSHFPVRHPSLKQCFMVKMVNWCPPSKQTANIKLCSVAHPFIIVSLFVLSVTGFAILNFAFLEKKIHSELKDNQNCYWYLRMCHKKIKKIQKQLFFFYPELDIVCLSQMTVLPVRQGYDNQKTDIMKW